MLRCFTNIYEGRKTMKKIVALLMTAVMTIGMATVAFAAPSPQPSTGNIVAAKGANGQDVDLSKVTTSDNFAPADQPGVDAIKSNPQNVLKDAVGAPNANGYGLAYVTEDRKTNGLILDESIRFNTTLARLNKVCDNGIINTDLEVQLAEQMTKEMGTKTPSNEQRIGNLSGGNQQKALLGKWMFTEPDILILDEPTRGIDVGAKYDIYCLINQMVGQGKSVIMILPKCLKFLVCVIVFML